MKVAHSPQEMKELCRASELPLGFVPTMGALHAGHAELVKLARKQCATVAVSVFVNPTQFNDPKDLDNYPRDFEADAKLLGDLGVDYLFYPNYATLYPDDYKYSISEKDLSTRFCGAHRPGHFDGVLTVVMKLLQIVQPDFAYFGEKDFQQLKLIEGLVQAFFLDTKIVPVPTVRESSGLAMSSRNERLSPEERDKAAVISKILKQAGNAAEARQQLTEEGYRVDYVEDYAGRRLAAVFSGTVRLIDNVEA